MNQIKHVFFLSREKSNMEMKYPDNCWNTHKTVKC